MSPYSILPYDRTGLGLCFAWMGSEIFVTKFCGNIHQFMSGSIIIFHVMLQKKSFDLPSHMVPRIDNHVRVHTVG